MKTTDTTKEIVLAILDSLSDERFEAMIKLDMEGKLDATENEFPVNAFKRLFPLETHAIDKKQTPN